MNVIRTAHISHLSIRGGSLEDLNVLLRQPTIAITGARTATNYGKVQAAALAEQAFARRATVVTGFGHGIDSAVIESALACDGRLIVVASHGLNVPTPLTRLLQEVIETGRGLVVSVEDDETRLSLSSSKRAYDLIASIAGAVVIVEAGIASRTVGLARRARASGVPTFAVPGPVTSALSSGTHALIHAGDAQLLSDLSDVPLLGGAQVEICSGENAAGGPSDAGAIIALGACLAEALAAGRTSDGRLSPVAVAEYAVKANLDVAETERLHLLLAWPEPR